ncbi:hypothetical protein K7X08_002244 [Anisodus acutangulus]|uniref:Methyltransferase type 11 domain-containing protein n=1 Tax=Anisodus acutangulus TaxID=402998 RepID=A0A9Q1R5A9_9SOLA|nr:hypothetical protein K7X08_002244 [Anisodus acutangulus]
MKEVGIDSASSLHTSESVGEAPVLRPVAVRPKCSSNVQSTPEIEKKYVHGVYDAIAPHFSSTRFAKWPKVSAFLSSLFPGSLILDAGCGNGKYLGLNPDCFFIGCDISAALINICTDRGHEVLVADAVNLPYRTGYGDATISIAVLHHLSNSSPTGSEKGYAEQQEYFVPWHLPYHRAEVSGASAVALASGLAKKDDKKGSVVYNRYYHVFSEGELERLVSDMDNAILVDRFYDKSNWCIILEKTS